MNIKLQISTLFVSALFIASCGNSKEEKKDSGTDTKVAKTENTAKTESPNPGKTDDLLAMLNGTTEGATKAYNTYAGDGLKQYNINAGWDEWNNYKLESPKVINVAGACCTIEAKSGITIRTYKICWGADDKLTGIDFLGMK